ncbi:MAG: hypothetical protein R2813_13595 [Flavobacteriales bacterium]
MEYVDRTGDDERDLRFFLIILSKGLREILFESDFRKLYERSDYTDWRLFEDAFHESYNEFVVSVETMNYDEKSALRAGLAGKSLELKIEFWNSLVRRFSNLRERQQRAMSFIGMGGILKKLLKFINIILKSAGVFGLAEGLEEIKQLSEFVINESVPDDWDE